MTSEASVDVREVIFVNKRCEKDYLGLPKDVLETADAALDTLQNCRNLTAKMFGPLTNDKRLQGIDEIKLPYGGEAYRVYVWLSCPYAVMVLDATQKKASTGIQMPEWQKEKLDERLKVAKAYLKANDADLLESFKGRSTRRTSLER